LKTAIIEYYTGVVCGDKVKEVDRDPFNQKVDSSL